MVHYTRNKETLRRDDSLPGAPVYRAKYRCTDCSQPILSKYAGPNGQCYKCVSNEQDIEPLNRIEAVTIYYPKRVWGTADGQVIVGLEDFGQEMLDAKEREHTEKMVEILSYGIVNRNYQNYDLLMIPPSSSEPNHMTPKAEGIEERFDIPFEDAIIEIEETGEMKAKNAAEREESAEDNYRCQTNAEGERVILLDDVVASMNTITAVAKAVAERGASQIVTVGMARSVDLIGLNKADLVVETNDGT